MAENKKSFIAYSDWKETFDNLSDEYAGKLIKHIFAYVNDENPESKDMIINAVFPNIKNSLKRDLTKWENQIKQRSEAGKRSAEIRATKINERSIPLNENIRNPTVNDNVTVNVNDTVINNNKPTVNPKFSFFNSLIDLGVEKQIINDWLAVRKTKKLTNTETAFKNLEKEFKKCGKPIPVIIEKCVTESWGGFKASWDWKDDISKPKSNYKQPTLII